MRRPHRQASGGTATSSISRDRTQHAMTVGENFPSSGQGAAYGGAHVAEFVALLTCPPGRSRLLRAA